MLPAQYYLSVSSGTERRGACFTLLLCCCAFKEAPLRARLYLLSIPNFAAAAAQETGFTY
jgi:hypothetical protein